MKRNETSGNAGTGADDVRVDRSSLYAEAEAVADSIGAPEARIEALLSIAGTLRGAKRRRLAERAEEIAAEIADPGDRMQAHRATSVALTRSHLDDAEDAAGAMPGHERDEVALRVALRRAIKAARRIPDPRIRVALTTHAARLSPDESADADGVGDGAARVDRTATAGGGA